MNFIGYNDGLSGESASRMITDHNGQVWVATTNGVSMFNGKRVVSYGVVGDERKRNNVIDLCEGADKSIYAATNDGVFELKLGDSQFRPILPEITKPLSLLADGDTIYIGCAGGLAIYGGKGYKLVSPTSARVSIECSVRGIAKSADDGSIWFLNRFAINRYDPKKGRLAERIDIRDQLPEKTSFAQIAVWHGKIYLGSKNNGLFVYDIRTRKVKAVGGIGNIISALSERGGRLCVATDGTGAFLLDCRTDSILEHYGMYEQGRYRLPTNIVYSYRRDANGVNWFGLSRYGLAYTYHVNPLFRTYAFGHYTTRGHNVSCYYRRGDELLIGTAHGLCYIHEAKGIVREFTPADIGDAHIISCIQYYNGDYYIGTYDGGLKIFNPEARAFRRQTLDHLLDYATVKVLELSPDSLLWIGTSEGLYVLQRNGTVKRYTEQNSKVIGGLITTITFDKNGNGWLTGQNGLSIYVASTGEFENANFPEGFFNKLRNLRISEGHGETVYATAAKQIHYTDLQMRKFGTLELPAGLLDETCYTFLDDMQGYFWMVTEKGLFRMSYDMHRLMHFGHSEGLMCDFISCMGIDERGQVWAASSNGLMMADTKDLARWSKQTKYKVLLYDIRKGGTLIPSSEESIVNDADEITVSWNLISRELRMTPIMADYAKPGGRLYEYRLDGKNEWTLLKDNEEIVLRYMLLGRHELDVRLAGVEGSERTYTIYVTPSLLAICELVLVIIAIALYILWRRYRRNTRDLLLERDQMEEALMEMEQDRNDDGQETEEPQKYQRVKLDEAECAEIVKRMREYIERERVYRNPELKRNDIADVLHISVTKMSQIFTLYLKENYYEFINKYRLEEFKRLIDEGEYHKYTITALSERCGFKKSAFFSTFRKVEGMTPTEYLKRKNIKVTL